MVEELKRAEDYTFEDAIRFTLQARTFLEVIDREATDSEELRTWKSFAFVRYLYVSEKFPFSNDFLRKLFLFGEGLESIDPNLFNYEKGDWQIEQWMSLFKSRKKLLSGVAKRQERRQILTDDRTRIEIGFGVNDRLEDSNPIRHHFHVVPILEDYIEHSLQSDKIRGKGKIGRDKKSFDLATRWMEIVDDRDKFDVKEMIDRFSANPYKFLGLIQGDYLMPRRVPSTELAVLYEQLIKRGLKPHIFESSTLRDVLQAISGKELVEGLNIIEKIKDSDFRFLTLDRPVESCIASEAFTVLYREAKSVDERVKDLGRKKIQENADEFAKRMFEVVTNLRSEEKISSYRETVEMLNKKNVPTYRGGSWHLKTFQNLTKRWKDLGFPLE